MFIAVLAVPLTGVEKSIEYGGDDAPTQNEATTVDPSSIWTMAAVAELFERTRSVR